ncbi:NUMOD4 domain-containing protein [Muribaculum intestinale]|uniref:NUMOD4 domain-containing protein n=1 Tax=Muribaculum intestinale TaxID=1796646 RepID=UPI00272A22CF|nr:NUMOD4 domain-containing protein [Muribaculum intestinale]
MKEEQQEIWKDVVGYEGLYKVSNHGRVMSFCNRKTPLVLKQRNSVWGYPTVCLCKGKKHHKTIVVHRLVAKAFIPNPNNFRVVNHKDEDKTNNNVNNLEWCTHEYNCAYGTARYRIGKAHINHPKMSKRVAQQNPEGELIRVFPSIREACRKLGINNGNLTEALKGKRRTCGGYVWKYINYKK